MMGATVCYNQHMLLAFYLYPSEIFKFLNCELRLECFMVKFTNRGLEAFSFLKKVRSYQITEKLKCLELWLSVDVGLG